MKIRSMSYFLREATINLDKNRSMSMASIGTVTISLTVLGLLCLVLLNLSNVMGSVQSKVEMRVFLRETVTPDKLPVIQESIGKVPGVQRVIYVSKDKALKRLKEQLGENMDLVKIVGDNPLPDSFQVKIKNTRDMFSVADAVSTFPGVEDVSYGEEFVDKLNTVSRIVWIFTIFSAVATGGAVLFIIVNTIRINLFARRREIEIMKLVGATDWFIKWPFLLEGGILGIVGALFATSICIFTYYFVAAKLYTNAPFIPFVPPGVIIYKLSGILVCIGLVVGATGSTISIRKFLHV